MTNRRVIENKISSIFKYLKILEGYRGYSREEVENDVNTRGAAERYLYLVAQAAIDLADTIISFKNLRKPSTLSESFHILSEADIIPQGLMEKMIKMTGFRNAIAHDYDKLDYDIVYDVLQNRLKDIEDFVKVIKRAL